MHQSNQSFSDYHEIRINKNKTAWVIFTVLIRLNSSTTSLLADSLIFITLHYMCLATFHTGNNNHKLLITRRNLNEKTMPWFYGQLFLRLVKKTLCFQKYIKMLPFGGKLISIHCLDVNFHFICYILSLCILLAELQYELRNKLWFPSRQSYLNLQLYP